MRPLVKVFFSVAVTVLLLGGTEARVEAGCEAWRTVCTTVNDCIAFEYEACRWDCIEECGTSYKRAECIQVGGSGQMCKCTCTLNEDR